MEAETLCRPDKQQQLWADCEIGVIIHYSRGLLGMQNLEGVPCYQAADATKLAPECLDTEQWLASAAELGAKYAVFVANQRNCQGISLWQSSSNPYSLKQSPYQNGTFDCVESFIRSCKKYHILPGLYYQTGYGGHYFEKEKYRTPGTPEHERYLKVTKGDLTELWTKYGSLFEIWFDGGADSLERTGLDLGRLLEEYQPEAICFQGPASHERNLRWIGNEDGIAACDTWSTTDQRTFFYDGTEKDELVGKGIAGGKFWIPAETDIPNRRPEGRGVGWGWAPDEENLVWTPEELLERYYTSVGRNSNLLLGQCIADDGKFQDTEQFRNLGKKICSIYEKNLGRTAGTGNSFSIRLPEGVVARTISVMEEIAEGERVREFRLIAETSEGEHELYHAQTIGHKRLIRLEPLRAEKIRLDILKSVGQPRIRNFEIFG